VKSSTKLLLLSKKLLPDFTMTSHTTPSPFVASASSEFSAALVAWRAFDGVFQTFDSWASNTSNPPHWLAIDLGAVYAVSAYSIRVRPATVENNPSDFQFQVSGNNIDWVTVHTVVNANFAMVENRIFPLSSIQTFRYFRVFITLSVGGNTCLITEFKLLQ